MMKNSYSDISLAPFWNLAGAFLLSLCWLLPNNARPWSTFHSDASAACVLILLSLVLLLRSTRTIGLQTLPVVVIATSLVPLIQYWAGVLPFSGQAWISTSYLLGFGLSIFTGQQWQRLNPLWMERVLFVAFLFAGIVSVFLALHQWLRLGESAGLMNIWVLDYSFAVVRPYANLGQPNQLAALLLWALVGCAWAVYRGHLGKLGASVIAALLLLGVALTQSRSAMIGVAIILLACWKWRHMAKSGTFRFYVAGLAGWYVLLIPALPVMGRILLLETQLSLVGRTTQESRPYMWRMALDAAMQKPWFGYGWNQVLPAQLAESDNYPKLAGMYVAQAHNLFIDFIVWAGFPLGLLLSGVLLSWLWFALRRVSTASQALYFTLILVTATHALVELPLHYAYFLLPIGLIIGSLGSSMQIWVWGTLSRNYLLGLWMMAACLLGLLINDYFRLESAYNDIRFEKANFVNAPKQHIPDTLVLNHLQYAIELYGVTPKAGMPSDVVKRFSDTTTFLPSAYNISKLAVILALNQQPDAARFWMHKAKSMMTSENYANAQKDWERASQQFPQIAATLQIQQ